MTYKIMFWVVALAFSFFYGRYAVVLFEVKVQGENAAKARWWPTLAWHNWVNFVGSFVGWAATYYFLFYRLMPTHSFSFKAEDLIPIVIGLLGVTGFLPYTLGKMTGIKS